MLDLSPLKSTKRENKRVLWLKKNNLKLNLQGDGLKKKDKKKAKLNFARETN